MGDAQIFSKYESKEGSLEIVRFKPTISNVINIKGMRKVPVDKQGRRKQKEGSEGVGEEDENKAAHTLRHDFFAHND